jgi:8-amino-7-oxononanoate synthase
VDPAIIHKRLQDRKREDSLRKLTFTSDLIDFTSNDYLGLARSEALFELIKNRIQSLPHKNGSTGSRLLSGNNVYTQEVEEYLARIFKSEAALIFNSGYAANQGVLSSIPQKGDTILYDELAHACIRDGARLSLASRYSFLHNDLNDLENTLKRAAGNIFIAVESIYSMDGDQCPLAELVELADRYRATIILDEAHGTGVFGEKGAGLAVSLGLENKIPIRIYTFGKAMGIHGACVAGSKELIEYLVNFARPFIFTTAPSPHSIAAIECAFKFLGNNIHLQEDLTKKIELFTSVCKKLNVQRLDSKSQIQGIIVSGNEKVKQTSEFLKDQRFDVRPILSPTVAKESERLRICLHTYNTDNEITQLANHLSKL